MTTRVDTEDISSTRSERFLAVVLTIFILIGAGWTYYKIGEVTEPDRDFGYTAGEMRAIDAATTATQQLNRAAETRDEAKTALEIARSNLEFAGEQDVARMQQEYDRAQQAYDAAQAKYATARTEADEAEAASDRAQKAYEKRTSDTSATGGDLLSAGLRLLLVATLTLGGFVMIKRMRDRESRYLPVGFAVGASGVVMALVFAFDYITDYLDLLDLGPIVLSVLGIAATLVAFAALQRYLARRIPRSRVRKGECPFCGFPVHDRGAHCEGCGREVVASCGTCDSPRRVGSPHCPACGAA